MAAVPTSMPTEALHLAMQDLQRTMVRSGHVILLCEEALASAAALSLAQTTSLSVTKAAPFASGPNQVTIAKPTATTAHTIASATP